MLITTLCGDCSIYACFFNPEREDHTSRHQRWIQNVWIVVLPAASLNMNRDAQKPVFIPDCPYGKLHTYNAAAAGFNIVYFCVCRTLEYFRERNQNTSVLFLKYALIAYKSKNNVYFPYTYIVRGSILLSEDRKQHFYNLLIQLPSPTGDIKLTHGELKYNSYHQQETDYAHTVN